MGECLARGELGEQEKAWNVWTGFNRWVHPEKPTRRTYRSVAHKRVGSSAGRFANNRNPLAQTNEHDHEKLDCTYCMNPATTHDFMFIHELPRTARARWIFQFHRLL